MKKRLAGEGLTGDVVGKLDKQYIDDKDSAMELATPYSQSLECCPQRIQSPIRATASQTQLAAIGTSRSLDLNLVTDEGDRVTLSLDAQAAALYARSESVSVGADGDYLHHQTELTAGSYQMDFHLSIEGDLNADERREIRKVVKTLSKMLNQLAGGQPPSGMAAAKKLAGLDTIASLEARLEYQQTALVAQQDQRAVIYNHFGELSETPIEYQTSNVQHLESKLEAMAEEMAAVVKRAKASWSDKLRAVEHLFEVHGKQASSKAKNHRVPNMLDYVQRRFRSAVEDARGDMDG